MILLNENGVPIGTLFCCGFLEIGEYIINFTNKYFIEIIYMKIIKINTIESN